ncbi:helix-turn-helix domain-containing protein, partial [Elstera sp.]|uniref:helix-turn-helix domain-containing protein n=1 Tax=Elstera sp. TaxID=1916664 RepID=UPI0037C14FB3
MNLRRYTFKLYPTAAQVRVLDAQRQALGALYNGLLQQRIEAYQRCVNPLTGKGKTLTAFDQGKEITALRADDPAYAAFSRGTLEQVVKRLDLAFQAFFKRAKAGAGAAAGFPRFQRTADYPSIPFREAGHGGWKFEPGPNLRHGRARFQAVPGWIKLRGKLPAIPLGLRTCEILFRGGAWFLSLVVDLPAPEAAPARPAGHVAFDLVTKFAVVKQSNGGCPTGPEAAFHRAVDGRISLSFPGVNAPSVPASLDSSGDDREGVDSARVQQVPASLDSSGDDRVIWSPAVDAPVPASLDSSGDDRVRICSVIPVPTSLESS